VNSLQEEKELCFEPQDVGVVGLSQKVMIQGLSLNLPKIQGLEPKSNFCFLLKAIFIHIKLL